MIGIKPILKSESIIIPSTIIFTIIIKETFEYIKKYNDYKRKKKIRNTIFLAIYYIIFLIGIVYQLTRIKNPFYYILLFIIFLCDVIIFLVLKK